MHKRYNLVFISPNPDNTPNPTQPSIPTSLFLGFLFYRPKQTLPESEENKWNAPPPKNWKKNAAVKIRKKQRQRPAKLSSCQVRLSRKLVQSARHWLWRWGREQGYVRQRQASCGKSHFQTNRVGRTRRFRWKRDFHSLLGIRFVPIIAQSTVDRAASTVAAADLAGDLALGELHRQRSLTGPKNGAPPS